MQEQNDNRKHAVIGVDPGNKGTAWLIAADFESHCCNFAYACPVEQASVFRMWTGVFIIVALYCEQVGPMPGEGVVGAFTFGMNYERWQAMARAYGIPVRLVLPQVWQFHFGLGDPYDVNDEQRKKSTRKNAHKAKATEQAEGKVTFTVETCDGYLIARYGELVEL